MSVPLNKYCVMEPRVYFKDSMVSGNYAIVKGGETYTYRNYPSNGCDNSGIGFTTPPPSFTDVLSRLVVLEVPLNIKFRGPGDGSDNAMIQSNRDAFRAFALESIIKNMTITINGENLTCNVNQVCHPFSRYYLDVERINEGITPNMLDTFADYRDADGSSRNPLGWYDNSAQNPRGAYFNYDIVVNTNTEAEIQGTLQSYIMMSPFEWLSAANNVVPGLTQLTTLDWNINFATNLSRVWSRSLANDVQVSSVDVTIGTLSGIGGGSANLKLLWITPRPEMRAYIKSLPSIKYPYFNTNRWTTTGTAYVAPGDSQEITSQVINFINIPNAIYIYCIRDESTYVNNLIPNITTTDTYGGIKKIDITMGNVTGILSTASPQQLYDICVKNGLQDTSINEFIGTTNSFNQSATISPNSKIGLTGSVIRLQPGIDLSLRDGLVQGVQDKTDFQVTVEVVNVNQYESIRFQLCTLVVYEGYLEIYNGVARTVIGPLKPQDALCNDYVHLDWNDLEKNYGGALGDRFKSFGRDIYKHAIDANKYLRKNKTISKGLKGVSKIPFLPYKQDFKDAADVAKYLGYGGCEDCDGGMLFEDQRGLVGGRKMAHRELKSRIKTRR